MTIGNGLVTVLPALMISVSGGLVITRTSSDTKLGSDSQMQVFNNPQPLMLASRSADCKGGLPWVAEDSVPGFVGGVGAIAWRISQKTAAGGKLKAQVPAPAREYVISIKAAESPASRRYMGANPIEEFSRASRGLELPRYGSPRKTRTKPGNRTTRHNTILAANERK